MEQIQMKENNAQRITSFQVTVFMQPLKNIIKTEMVKQLPPMIQLLSRHL